jgi:hypothetical protein
VPLVQPTKTVASVTQEAMTSVCRRNRESSGTAGVNVAPDRCATQQAAAAGDCQEFAHRFRDRGRVVLLQDVT